MRRPPAAAGVPASRASRRRRGRPRTRWPSGGCSPTGWPRTRAPSCVRHALARVVGPVEADRLAGRYPDGGPTGARRRRPPPPATPRRRRCHGAGRARPRRRPSSIPRRVASRPRLPDALAWLDPAAPRGNSNAWVVSGRRDGHRPPDPGQRPAPAHRAALGVVRGAPGSRRPRRAGRVGPRHALRRHRPQRPHRLGLHQHRRRRAGLRRRAYRHRRPPRTGGARLGTGGRWKTRPFRSAGGPSRRRSRSGAPVRGSSTPTRASSGRRRRHGCRPMRRARGSSARWFSSGRGSSGGFADAFEAVDRAGTWEEFQSALDRLSALSQNAVYADVDGNIGYLMTGPVTAAGPRRRRPGRAAPPRSSGRGRWAGAALPRHAESRARVTWPAQTTRWCAGTSPFITRDWAAPYRAARVTNVLAEATALDMAGAANLQQDVTQRRPLPVCWPSWTAPWPPRPRLAPTPAVKETLERLKRWDRRGRARARTPRSISCSRIGSGTAPSPTTSPTTSSTASTSGPAPSGRQASMLSSHDPGSRWWDDIGTVDRRESRDDVYLLAADDAARPLPQMPSGSRGLGSRARREVRASAG